MLMNFDTKITKQYRIYAPDLGRCIKIFIVTFFEDVKNSEIDLKLRVVTSNELKTRSSMRRSKKIVLSKLVVNLILAILTLAISTSAVSTSATSTSAVSTSLINSVSVLLASVVDSTLVIDSHIAILEVLIELSIQAPKSSSKSSSESPVQTSKSSPYLSSSLISILVFTSSRLNISAAFIS